jgi:hypothetical protein
MTRPHYVPDVAHLARTIQAPVDGAGASVMIPGYRIHLRGPNNCEDAAAGRERE